MTATPAAIAPDQLYFALLDRPFSARGRARAEELAYAFEATLPVPIESVHPVYRLLPDARVLAIGIDREKALHLARSHPVAHPAAWPDWLAPIATALDPRGINLLTGPCSSALVETSRHQTLRHALVGLTLITIAASAGFERRIRVDRSHADETRHRTDAVYQQALGGGMNTGQPPAARMTSELRRLRATRTAQDAGQTQQPADLALANLLAVWPESSRARTESITVAERTIDVVLRVTDLESAQAFVTALGSAKGLIPGPAKTDREGGEVRVSLRFDRETTP